MPIDVSEVLNLYEYERVRPDVRSRVIETKQHRRVSVGRYLSFLFENRETVLFQIQEMCRAERLVEAAKIAEEVQVYNELLPGPGELSATMMIEITDRSQIQPVLDKLLGIDTRGYVSVWVDDERFPGRFEEGRSDEDRGKVSAVHFVRFALSPQAWVRFPMADVSVVVDHPNERARTPLSLQTKLSLAADLR